MARDLRHVPPPVGHGDWAKSPHPGEVAGRFYHKKIVRTMPYYADLRVIFPVIARRPRQSKTAGSRVTGTGSLLCCAQTCSAYLA